MLQFQHCQSWSFKTVIVGTLLALTQRCLTSPRQMCLTPSAVDITAANQVQPALLPRPRVGWHYVRSHHLISPSQWIIHRRSKWHLQARALVVSKAPSRALFLLGTDSSNTQYSSCARRRVLEWRDMEWRSQLTCGGQGTWIRTQTLQLVVSRIQEFVTAQCHLSDRGY